jgi:hypothetical protein
MDEESIVRLAQEAGIYYREIEDEFCEADKDGVPIKMMAKFAALVAAVEREQCAKVCEEFQGSENDEEAWKYAAAAIRARGESK